MRVSRPAHTEEALIAIGRNVVNFQRLERCLKYLAVLSPLTATPKTVTSLMAKRVAAVERFTLGAAVRAWISPSFEESFNLQEAPSGIDIVISHRIETLKTPEEVSSHAADLLRLVAERNELIHQQLAAVDFENEEACHALIESLDEQNRRIAQMLTDVGETAQEVREIVDWMASEEGMDQIMKGILAPGGLAET